MKLEEKQRESSMATELNSIFGGESKGDEEPTAIVTRDLLGHSSSIKTQELDLDLHVPSGWEKQLDLKSGEVYIQKYNSYGSPSVSEHKFHMNQVGSKLQGFNFSPSSSKVTLNSSDEKSLNLKLVSSSSLASSNYQSVCTLDTVKSALERQKKEPIRKRASPLKSAPSASYSSSSSSIREIQEEEIEEKFSSPMAAGCPGCLSYVLIMKHNPKCPRCNSVVPSPLLKKPKIDLNISI